jgi:sarcosine oxidase
MMTTLTADAIVLGVGGVGSAACLHLARRGLRVIGLDRFPPGHDRGSSHGSTRIIRLAYFEHPDYVPLLSRAYALWESLAAETGEQLYVETGLLEVGPESGTVIQGILESARTHDLAIDRLSPADLAKACPGIVAGDGMTALFERRAGYLRVEDCTRAHAHLAEQAGASLRIGETVLGWEARNGGVEVRTEIGTYSAARLIITPGAWAPALLGSLGIGFEVIRKSLYWYATEPGAYNVQAGAPCFFFDTPAGEFYGFPRIDADGLKVAEHSRGLPVTDPLRVDRSENCDETVRVESFLRDHMPLVTSHRTRFETCLYTLSPDRHFVVDRHPAYPQVAFAAGLSGHGFKFASVLGQALAHLGPGETPDVPIEFLSAKRFGT